MKYSAGYHVFLSLFFLVYHVQSISFEEAEEQIKELITWLKENGGKMNSKVDIKRIGNTTGFGVFANSDIPPKATLFKLPWNILLTGGTPVVGDHVTVNKNQQNQFVDAVITAYHEHDNTYGVRYTKTHTSDIVKSRDVSFYSGRGLECVTVANMVKEMKLGNDSKYAPFVNYLNSQQPGQLPSAWSVAGKKLLQEVLGENLPPTDPFQWSYQTYCGGPYDPFYENAAMLQLQRSWDDIMIPIFDLLNHRNGKWLNTHSDNIVPDVPVVIKSSREIKAGEEIYNTFNFCSDCNARFFGYGTPEILRDYGFVEQYPQLWYLPKMDINFEIEEDEVDSKRFRIKWLGQSRSQDFNLLDSDLQRLKLLNETKFSMTIKDVPQNEQTIIHEFVEAAIVAFTIALKGYRQECMNHGNSEADCRYDRLQHGPDPLNYNAYLCDFGLKFEFPDHLKVDEVQSPYQLMYINRNPHNKDTCFSLDHIYQICGSYRPHYHEMNVHYTARFLDQIKRVVWVGGGDSMLLHEIIKYPSLELVIGLEIDQTVTRKSFKHFGTQPHWDNDKVQWWYGDAAKSLLMLPKEYFGSFDMVLVDLSETVMSITVTKELDIMAALGLLLKPEGILVKNEIYFEQLSDLFEYTLQIHFYDVPVICSQALILASNKVDFLSTNLINHHVETLWPSHFPEEEIMSNYEIWHDYRKNETHSKVCQHETTFDGTNEEQEASPGILMIFEAEQIRVDLQDTSNFISLILSAIESAGLSVASLNFHPIPENNNNALIAYALNEGYIIARTWVAENYCALDIHFWSNFEKQDIVKKSIIETLGNIEKENSSSYRIVAGGMFGAAYWKADISNRGPRSVDSCEAPTFKDDIKENVLLEENNIARILQEGFSVIPETKFRVAVFCGKEREICETAEKIRNFDRVREVVELRSCENDSTEEDLIACEKNILKKLKESSGPEEDDTIYGNFSLEKKLEIGCSVVVEDLEDSSSSRLGSVRTLNHDGTVDVTYKNGDVVFRINKNRIRLYRSTKDDQNKFRAAVFDKNASYTLGRIVKRLFSNMDYKKRFLFSNILLFSFAEEQVAPWRRNLFDRFRTEIFVHDPVYHAEILLSDAKQSINLDIMSSGNANFIKDLKDVKKILEEHDQSVVFKVQNIQGAQYNFQPEFEPPPFFFLPQDYDRSSPLKQWRSQKSLGRQTIFQFENQETEEILEDIEKEVILKVGDEISANYEYLGDYFLGEILRINKDGTYDIKYEDGDEEYDVSTRQIKIPKKIPISDSHLSPTKLEKALLISLSNAVQSCEGTSTSYTFDTKVFTNFGEGALLITLWFGGTAAVLWDGKRHLDINLFTYLEKEEVHEQFKSSFMKEIPSLSSTLRDTQPRGIGRVVNFSSDYDPLEDPSWM